jgi:hypothetical protein
MILLLILIAGIVLVAVAATIRQTTLDGYRQRDIRAERERRFDAALR